MSTTVSLHAELLVNIKTLSLSVRISCPPQPHDKNASPTNSAAPPPQPSTQDLPPELQLYVEDDVLRLGFNGAEAAISIPFKNLITDPSNLSFSPSDPNNQAAQPDDDADREMSSRLPVSEAGLSQLFDGLGVDGGSEECFDPWPAAVLNERDFELRCSDCGAVVVERGRVRQWKDLPSVGAGEMMELWNCHSHGHSHEAQGKQSADRGPHAHVNGRGEDPGAEMTDVNGGGRAESPDRRGRIAEAYGSLHATPGAGFVDTTSLVVHVDDVSDALKTRTCPCETHTKTHTHPYPHNLSFPKPSLSLHPPPPHHPSTHPPAKFLTAHMLLQQARYATTKFLICDSNRPLLLWLFTPDLIYWSSSSSSASRSSSAAGSGRTHPAHPQRACKILYKHLSPRDVDDARNTDKVSVIDALPAAARGECIDALQISHEGLPKGARFLREWRVGLLARFGVAELGGGEGTQDL